MKFAATADAGGLLAVDSEAYCPVACACQEDFGVSSATASDADGCNLTLICDAHLRKSFSGNTLMTTLIRAVWRRRYRSGGLPRA